MFLCLLCAGLFLSAQSCSRKSRGSAAAPKQEAEILFRRMQAAWNQIFTLEGAGEYRMARFTVYSGEKETKCGKVAAGIHHCPDERLIAAEQGWLDAMRRSGGALLDYALARTLARHVQHELTIDERVEKAAQAEPPKREELLRKREIQADCFVGLWRRFHEGEAPPLEALQQAARQWTAEQSDERLRAIVDARLDWMRRGFDGGELSACNIFAEPAAAAPAEVAQPRGERKKRQANQ